MTSGKYLGKSFLLKYRRGFRQKESLLVQEKEEMKADYDKLLVTPGLQLVDCSSVCFPHSLLDTGPILLHVPRPTAI